MDATDAAEVSIRVAAARLGLHPQSLRYYERVGIVVPTRTPGGARRYGPDDLERVRQIRELGARGVNLAGIRIVFELQERLREAERARREAEERLASLHSGRPGA